MTDRPLDTPPPAPASAIPSNLVGDILGVLTNPEVAIPKVVKTPGFVFAGIIAGAFVIVGTLTVLFVSRAAVGIWPGFPEVMKELLALIAVGAILTGVVFGLAVSLFKRPDIKIEQAANAAAVMLIPWILIDVVLVIFSPFPRFAGYLVPLMTLVPVAYLFAAMHWGLGLSLGQSLVAAVVAAFVALVVHHLISGDLGSLLVMMAQIRVTGPTGMSVQDANRALQQTMQAVQQAQQWGR